MDGSGGAAPVGHIAGVESCVARGNAHQGELVGEEGEVGGGGGEGVDERGGGGRDNGVNLPLVEGHSWVGLVGAVECGVGANWNPQMRVIYTNTVDHWLACS